jgi:hypothetical protein
MLKKKWRGGGLTFLKKKFRRVAGNSQSPVKKIKKIFLYKFYLYIILFIYNLN